MYMLLAGNMLSSRCSMRRAALSLLHVFPPPSVRARARARGLCSTAPHPVLLAIESSRAQWEALGFSVSADDTVRLNDITLRLHPSGSSVSGDAAPGVIGWAFSDNEEAVRRLQTVTTTSGSSAAAVVGIPLVSPVPGLRDVQEEVSHRNGVYEIDHIVLHTRDLNTVKSEFSALGMELKREIVNDKKCFSQSFYRPHKTIIEIISQFSPGDTNTHSAESTPGTMAFSTPQGGTSLWGITFSCIDIDLIHALLPTCTKIPYPALQRGRRMTVINPRHMTEQLPLRLAFMSPHVRE